MKKAIIAVSFGTSYPDTLEKTIAATERALAVSFSGWEVRRAFTSGRIIEKLCARDGVLIDNVTEALQRLLDEGYTHVAVQPTHVMHGEEYEKMLAQVEPFRSRMKLSIGMPLLHAECDYTAVAAALLRWLGEPEEDEALIFMGHGTPHFANSAYAQMEHVLQLRCERVFVATVEGYPTLDSVLAKLQKRPQIRRITLVPFMLVAGDHAKNDMAGGTGSWKSTLEAQGYAVHCVMKGIGECKAVQDLFVQHCREAVSALLLQGRLYGVGVGPGDPELMTMKAVRVLRAADVVMAPDTNGSDNTALRIARPYLSNQEVIFVKTPMVRNQSVMDAAHTAAAKTICALLDEGKQVVFLTLGDPTVYSTYLYIHQKVLALGYPAEIVPGVPSFCAAAARLGISLCLGAEPLLIIPASHDAEKLMDVPANKVFMKAGRSILELQKLLAEHGKLENASMVENCSMPTERVYPHFDELKEPTGYFSLVIAKEGTV